MPATPVASGTGTDGTPWVLKSMYDHNSADAVVIGEAFAINTAVAGQVWTVTFAGNGTAFFSAGLTSTPAGVQEVQVTPHPDGASRVTAHAVNQQTGEVIDGAVTLPPAPATCGGH